MGVAKSRDQKRVDAVGRRLPAEGSGSPELDRRREFQIRPGKPEPRLIRTATVHLQDGLDAGVNQTTKCQKGVFASGAPEQGCLPVDVQHPEGAR